MGEGGIDAAVIHPPPWDAGAHDLAMDADKRLIMGDALCAWWR